MLDLFRKKPPKAQKRARKPPTKKTVQKPYKLTDKRQERICDGLAVGMPRSAAASLGGISRKTFYNWLEIPEFLEAVEMAESLAIKTAFTIVIKSPTSAWKFIVSKFPELFSDKIQLEVMGPQIIDIEWPEEQIE